MGLDPVLSKHGARAGTIHIDTGHLSLENPKIGQLGIQDMKVGFVSVLVTTITAHGRKARIFSREIIESRPSSQHQNILVAFHAFYLFLGSKSDLPSGQLLDLWPKDGQGRPHLPHPAKPEGSAGVPGDLSSG